MDFYIEIMKSLKEIPGVNLFFQSIRCMSQ